MYMSILGQVHKEKIHTWEKLETELWVGEIFNYFVLDDGFHNLIILRYIHRDSIAKVC